MLPIRFKKSDWKPYGKHLSRLNGKLYVILPATITVCWIGCWIVCLMRDLTRVDSADGRAISYVKETGRSSRRSACSSHDETIKSYLCQPSPPHARPSKRFTKLYVKKRKSNVSPSVSRICFYGCKIFANV